MSAGYRRIARGVMIALCLLMGFALYVVVSLLVSFVVGLLQ